MSHQFEYGSARIKDLSVTTAVDKHGKTEVTKVSLDGRPLKATTRFWNSLHLRFGITGNIFRLTQSAFGDPNLPDTLNFYQQAGVQTQYLTGVVADWRFTIPDNPAEIPPCASRYSTCAHLADVGRTSATPASPRRKRSSLRSITFTPS